jgi:hypothetical protein
MASFSVFLPPGANSTPEKIVFLRDGFSSAAFILGPVWLLWKQAWLPAAAVVAILSLMPLLANLPGVSPLLPGFLGMALAVWLGFEGREILGWSLKRRGYVESDVIVAENEEEAEEVYFARLSAATGAQPMAESAA